MSAAGETIALLLFPDELEATPVLSVGLALFNNNKGAADGAEDESSEGSKESDNTSTVGLNEIGLTDGEDDCLGGEGGLDGFVVGRKIKGLVDGVE